MPQLRKLANQLVDAQFGPTTRELERERERSASAITGFTKALAGELGTIAPKVQQTYSQAAGAQSGFAKGFADGLRQLQADTGAQNADIVQNIAGGGQTIDTTGAGDVLYGQSGFIPASTLNQAGAAATAYAQQLPGFAARRGQDSLLANQAEFRKAMEEIRKQRPEKFNEILQNLLQFELSKFGARINAGYLQNARQGQRQDFALGMAGLAQRQREQRQARADEQREARGDRRENRQDRRRELWEDFSSKVERRADSMFDETKPNPAYVPELPEGPTNPKTIKRYTYVKAYQLLWESIGRALVQKGFNKDRVTDYIRLALRQAGFVPPQYGIPGN